MSGMPGDTKGVARNVDRYERVLTAQTGRNEHGTQVPGACTNGAAIA